MLKHFEEADVNPEIGEQLADREGNIYGLTIIGLELVEEDIVPIFQLSVFPKGSGKPRLKKFMVTPDQIHALEELGASIVALHKGDGTEQSAIYNGLRRQAQKLYEVFVGWSSGIKNMLSSFRGQSKMIWSTETGKEWSKPGKPKSGSSDLEAPSTTRSKTDSFWSPSNLMEQQTPSSIIVEALIRGDVNLEDVI